MEALVKIIDIELKGLHQRIENIGYKMIIDDEAKRFVASKGYDIQFGARPLKRAIQKLFGRRIVRNNSWCRITARRYY